MKKTTEWFKNWFDSPYYHVLYKHRNHKEANAFISLLLDYLAPEKSAHFLDKACGRGRHASYLAKRGFIATGLDLSPNNIQYAQQKWGKIAQFQIHDMRLPYQKNTFDYVLSLFTSFGYFDNDKENLKVLQSALSDLKPGGTMVLDFLNVNWVEKHILEQDKKEVSGIQFCQKRQIKEGWIIKNIAITDQNEEFYFEEKVKAINADELQIMFADAGFKVNSIFGNYKLQPFDAQLSERVIIIATKP